MEYIITDMGGTELPKSSQVCKVRLAKTYKPHDMTMAIFNNQLKELSDKDLQDFRDWYTTAGYPTV